MTEQTETLADRVEVLEAAAREVVAYSRQYKGAYWGDVCRWCDTQIDRHGHRPTCPVRVLELALGQEE